MRVGHAVDVLESVLAESYDKVSFINLRFEQLSFSQLSQNPWNGDSVAPTYQGRTINTTGQSKEAGRAAGVSVLLVSVRDGTRLCAISELESPFMSSPFKSRRWFSPILVLGYGRIVATVTSLFRASVVMIVHDLEDVGVTNSCDLRRIFKLADDNGFWIYCLAHGKHVESNVLKNMRHICICVGTGRSQVGSLPQGLWMFIYSFCMALGRKLELSLLQGVGYKEAIDSVGQFV